MATKGKKATKSLNTENLPKAWIDSINIPLSKLEGLVEVHVLKADPISREAYVVLPSGEMKKVNTEHLYESERMRTLFNVKRPVKVGTVPAPRSWTSFFGLVEGRIREVVLRYAYSDFVKGTSLFEICLVDENKEFDSTTAVRTDRTDWYPTFEAAQKLETETLIHADGTVEKRGGGYRKYALTPEQKAAFNAINAAIEAARSLGIRLTLDMNNGQLAAINNAAGDVIVEYAGEPDIDKIPMELWEGGAYLDHMNDDESFAVSASK